MPKLKGKSVEDILAEYSNGQEFSATPDQAIRKSDQFQLNRYPKPLKQSIDLNQVLDKLKQNDLARAKYQDLIKLPDIGGSAMSDMGPMIKSIPNVEIPNMETHVSQIPQSAIPNKDLVVRPANDVATRPAMDIVKDVKQLSPMALTIAEQNTKDIIENTAQDATQKALSTNVANAAKRTKLGKAALVGAGLIGGGVLANEIMNRPETPPGGGAMPTQNFLDVAGGNGGNFQDIFNPQSNGPFDAWNAGVLAPVEEKKEEVVEPVKSSQTSSSSSTQVSKSSKPVAAEQTANEEGEPRQQLGADDELLRAMATRDRSTLAAELGQAGAQIAASIAGLGAGAPVTANTELFKSIAARAGKPVEDIEKEREQETVRAKLLQQREAFDSKSQVSKLYRDLAKEVVPSMKINDSMSASDFEKLGLNLSAMYNMKMQNETNLAMAKERERDRAETKKEKEDYKKELELHNFIERSNKQISGSKEYKNFNDFNRKALEVEDAIKNPSSIKDIASLYTLVKGMDPDSAVRGSELQLAAGASNIWGDLMTQMSRLGGQKSTRKVPPEVLKQMGDYLNIARRGMGESYVNYIGAKKQQLEKRGGKWEDYGASIDPNFSYTNQLMKQREGQPDRLMNLIKADEIDPKIQEFAKQNNVTYEEAKNAIEKRKQNVR